MKPSRGKSWILVGPLAALILSTFLDYGLTWDETEHSMYGARVVAYYVSGFQNRSFAEFLDLYYHGALFDSLAHVAGLVSPVGPFETRHLLNAFAGLLGIYGVFLTARRLGGEMAGLLAAGLLAALPLYYGHMYANPKDIPFAVATVWALYFAVRFFEDWPRPDWKAAAALGAAIGTAVSVRAAGIVLVLYVLAGAAALYRLLQPPADKRRLVLAAGCAAGASLLSVLFFWPWLQMDPVGHFLETLGRTTRFISEGTTLFGGTQVELVRLPRSYVPVLLGYQLPELHLLLTAGGLCFLITERTRISSLEPWRRVSAAVLTAAVLLPLVQAMAVRAVVYDGIRHFLFVLPPLCVLLGIAAAHLVDLLKAKARPLRLAAAGALAVWFVWHLSVLWRLHPYEYIYFNGLARWKPGAGGQYETDYWGASYKEATEWLVRYTDSLPPPEKPYRVLACGHPMATRYYFSERLQPVSDPAQADFFIAQTRLDCDRQIEAPVLHAVSRMGVNLTYVKDLRKPPG